MSRSKIVRNIPTYFKNPLVEGKYRVLPPPLIPSHIIAPPYVNNSNPQFGQYEGKQAIQTPQAIQKLRAVAQIACKTLQDTKNFIEEKAAKDQPITQEDIDKFVFDSIVKQGAYPTPIGFMHFPKSVCVSVNECFVHGIPSTRPLQRGDKINIDVTAYFDGFHGDNNLTVFYGEPDHPDKLRVAHAAQQALYAAIGICRPGLPINQLGKAIQKVATEHKTYVCQQFSGHGIGHLLHMPPMVFHRYYPNYKQVMQAGQIFTIEPILTLHPLSNIKIWADKFTAISANNPNAQFEHTILITKDGCQILTKRPSETIPNPNGTISNA